MSAHVVIVDIFGLVLVALGFSMAFRQSFVRRMLGWSPAQDTSSAADPAAYGLRIAGVMVMVFGFALGVMVTLFNLA
jgi:hypothetical protein